MGVTTGIHNPSTFLDSSYASFSPSSLPSKLLQSEDLTCLGLSVV
jgi:hypothetical protein